jgi:transposase
MGTESFIVISDMAHEENRKRLEFLYTCGYTSGVALCKITGIPKSTVYDVLARIRAGEDMEHQPGAGRPRSLDANNRRRLCQLALKNPMLSAAAIRDKAVLRGCPSVSARTVQRSLSGSGIFKLVPKPVLALTPEQKRKRVLFCDEHLMDDFSKTFFTDESSFLLERHRCPRWCAKQPKRIPTSKFSKTVMIWGGISTMGPTSIAIIQGSVDQYKYQDILAEHLVGAGDAYYGENWRLQQDNATPHSARSTKEWLEANVPSILPWPANSADLSPIENVWTIVKDAVEKSQPKNINEFRDSIVSTWNQIDADLTSRLIASMPARLKACRDLRGEEINLKYI